MGIKRQISRFVMLIREDIHQTIDLLLGIVYPLLVILSLGRVRKRTYCMSVGSTIVSWKSKKENVARSSVDAEYLAMTIVTCELIWIKQHLQELYSTNEVIL